MNRPNSVNRQFIVSDKFDIRAFGRRLQERREALGMTQAELARKLGGHGSKLSVWESGQRAPRSPETLLALAGALGCSVDFLLTGRTVAGTDMIIGELEAVLDRVRRIRMGEIVSGTLDGPAVPVRRKPDEAQDEGAA